MVLRRTAVHCERNVFVMELRNNKTDSGILSNTRLQ